MNLLLCLILTIFTVELHANKISLVVKDTESAVVHDDNSVSFRFIAPDADEVMVAGDFVEKVEDNPI